MHFWQKGKDFLTGLFFTWRKYKKKSRPSRERDSFTNRASCRIRTNDPEITNHVLWPTELKRQVGKLTISRRYNQLPLLRSSPGGFEGSWPYGTYPYFKYLAIPELSARYFLIAGAKVSVFFESAIPFDKKMKKI